MEWIRRILVASGVTTSCKQIVDRGVSLASKYGAELYVVHVVHNPFGYEGFNLPMISLDESYKKIIMEAKEDLERIVAKERSKGLDIRILIKEGEPSKVLLDLVREMEIDLLIMRAYPLEESMLEHLEWRLENLIFGRRNEKILRAMPCAVLLVKDKT